MAEASAAAGEVGTKADASGRETRYGTSALLCAKWFSVRGGDEDEIELRSEGGGTQNPAGFKDLAVEGTKEACPESDWGQARGVISTERLTERTADAVGEERHAR